MKRFSLLFLSTLVLCLGAELTPDDTRIAELISRLAISQEPAGEEPIYTRTKDTPKTDKRVIAYDAAERLREFGTKAFPALLKSLDDRRQSVAFRRVVPHDVGLA